MPFGRNIDAHVHFFCLFDVVTCAEVDDDEDEDEDSGEDGYDDLIADKEGMVGRLSRTEYLQTALQ